MEHHFTGPSYTIGIEEELMICDARSFDLVNAIYRGIGGEAVLPSIGHTFFKWWTKNPL